LLTILGIIVILVGILVPALGHLRDVANRKMSTPTKAEIMIEAKILSVNGQIFSDTKTIGQFLDGKQITSNVVKVGVEFTIDKTTFLEDLELSHAQISYLKREKEIPLKISVEVRSGTTSNLRIYLKGCLVKKIWLKNDLATKLVKHMTKRR
jgi:hypothetical protein